MLRLFWMVPAALLSCLALAAFPAPLPGSEGRPQENRSEKRPKAPRRGPRPGDPGFDLFLRNGCAAGIEGLWVIGRIDTGQLVAELCKLLAEGPCPKADQVLRRLAQCGRPE
jgi:hypothetical protein